MGHTGGTRKFVSWSASLKGCRRMITKADCARVGTTSALAQPALAQPSMSGSLMTRPSSDLVAVKGHQVSVSRPVSLFVTG